MKLGLGTRAIVASLLLFGLLDQSATARQQSAAPAKTDERYAPLVVQSTSDGNSRVLDAVRQTAREEDRTILFVSRLGRGERGMRLHRRRLHNAVERVTQDGNGWPGQRVIATVGTRVEGQGRMEVYLDGRLSFVFEMRSGQDFPVDCCDEFPEYYPWRKAEPSLKFE
jgi:hypothetical protein